MTSEQEIVALKADVEYCEKQNVCITFAVARRLLHHLAARDAEVERLREAYRRARVLVPTHAYRCTISDDDSRCSCGAADFLDMLFNAKEGTSAKLVDHAAARP